MQKTILVTGATGGIGAPLCERLALAGQTLVLAARNVDRLDALSARLEGTGKHTIIPVDMSDDASIAAFGSALATFGRPLDGAVLCRRHFPATRIRFRILIHGARTFRRALSGLSLC
jgi:3-oxoacyl-[acyl-carrier protein] reductase